MSDFENIILNQTQDQMNTMWYQFSPFGKEKKYNELEEDRKKCVDYWIVRIKENIEKIKRNPALQQRLIDTFNDTFNKYGLKFEEVNK